MRYLQIWIWSRHKHIQLAKRYNVTAYFYLITFQWGGFSSCTILEANMSSDTANGHTVIGRERWNKKRYSKTKAISIQYEFVVYSDIQIGSRGARHAPAPNFSWMHFQHIRRHKPYSGETYCGHSKFEYTERREPRFDQINRILYIRQERNFWQMFVWHIHWFIPLRTTHQYTHMFRMKYLCHSVLTTARFIKWVL